MFQKNVPLKYLVLRRSTIQVVQSFSPLTKQLGEIYLQLCTPVDVSQ